MQNPLIPDLERLLREHPAGLSEHEVLKALAGHALFRDLDSGESRGLFRRHFLVMNGLYQLQERLWRNARQGLTISPLRIRVLPSACAREQALAAADTGVLRAYYLDWTNFETPAAEVEAMLADFWQRLRHGGARQQALEALALPAATSRADITRRYRQLAARHHPDRGGKTEDFVRIRQAYELLLAGSAPDS